MQKKYQIFISSTYTDLIEERKYVQEIILSMNHFPVGMELFSAASEEQWDIIKRTIDTSDFYILIIGYRYGSEMPDGIGYTEREFLYAKEKKIPIIVFLKEEGLSVKDSQRNSNRVKQQKLKKFVAKAKDGREVSWWANKEELGQKVTVSLYKEFNRANRPGWVRATDLAPNGFRINNDNIISGEKQYINNLIKIHTLEAKKTMLLFSGKMSYIGADQEYIKLISSKLTIKNLCNKANNDGEEALFNICNDCGIISKFYPFNDPMIRGRIIDPEIPERTKLILVKKEIDLNGDIYYTAQFFNRNSGDVIISSLINLFDTIWYLKNGESNE